MIQSKFNADKERDLVFLRDMHDCVSIADQLRLKGASEKRLCPACHNSRPRGDSPAPTLTLSQRYFECSRCGVKGDVVDLVCLVRNCAQPEAVNYLTELGLKRRQQVKARERAEAEFNELRDSMAGAEEEKTSLARKAYLTLCRPFGDEEVEALRGTGITAEVANHFRLRMPPVDPTGAIAKLSEAFDHRTLLEAGVAEEVVSPEGKARLRLKFDLYDREGMKYILVPYFQSGRAVFIRAIMIPAPDQRPMSHIPPFLGTAAQPPCPFNIDSVTGSGALFVMRREVEAMQATAAGYAAISTSCTQFPKDILPRLAGHEVYLVGPAGEAMEAKFKQVDGLFRAAKLPEPKRIMLQKWESLVEALGREMDQADTAMISYEYKSKRIETLAEIEKATVVAQPADETPKSKGWSPLAFVTDLLPSFGKKKEPAKFSADNIPPRPPIVMQMPNYKGKGDSSLPLPRKPQRPGQ